MGESTTPFDPRGRTRGKPSQLLLDNYKYLEYLYKYSIRLHQPSETKIVISKRLVFGQTLSYRMTLLVSKEIS